MVKRKYRSPIVMFDLEPGGDDVIIHPGSQGTSGEDPIFEWDPKIDEADIEMFWANYDDTWLAEIAGEDNYISYDEFYNWLDSIGGW